MNNFIKYLILTVAFVGKLSFVSATTCESTATPSGVWGDDATWDCGTAPAAGVCYDTIIIGQNTYIDDHVDLTGCPPIVLIVNDSLTFKSGKKLHLPAGSIVIIHVGGYLIPEGGGGNSNQLNIGGSVFWNAGDGVLSGNSVLDIELTEFYATQLEKAVQLLWTTRSEVNNDYFTIEKSKDGSNFEKVGDINGAGNSSSEINYSFMDNHTFIGTSYYRLKQTDFDGSSTYSQIIRIEVKDEEVEITLYPNPATDYFSLQAKTIGDLSIYSSTGKLVRTVENYDGEFISVEYLEKGIYLIAYEVRGKIKTKKLILK